MGSGICSIWNCETVYAVMRTDANTNVDGRYLVRSVYFDNYEDKALREKINGISEREKFRIRYHNDDLSYIVLEKRSRIMVCARNWTRRSRKRNAGNYGRAVWGG